MPINIIEKLLSGNSRKTAGSARLFWMEEIVMLVKTKYFGEIDLGEDKIITFEKGLMGFENFTKYTIFWLILEIRNMPIYKNTGNYLKSVF